MNYDAIIVGAGFTGSIFARELAETLDYKVLVIDKRAQIAGNMYDEKDDYGVLVQRYGPHTIITNEYSVIDYLKRYSELFRFDVKLMSYIDGQYVRLPFNYLSLRQLVGEKKSVVLLKKMRAHFSNRDRVSIFELVEHIDDDVSEYGEMLFEKAYKTYTAKMWGLSPDEIDRSVLDRVQMSMGYDERYINRDYQYMPVGGFTKLFENILNHPNITIELNQNALDNLTLDYINYKVLYNGESCKKFIFTGAIDELFDEKHGQLPYRSLLFKYENYKYSNVLPSDIISYPQADGFTRSTEYIKITGQKFEDVSSSTVVTEYPVAYDKEADNGANIRYYPVLKEDGLKLYEKYKEEAGKFPNLILAGRLAEFRYYNMDGAILSALKKVKLIIEKEE